MILKRRLSVVNRDPNRFEKSEHPAKKPKPAFCDEEDIPIQGRQLLCADKTLLLGPRPRLHNVIASLNPGFIGVEGGALWNQESGFEDKVWLIGDSAGFDFYGAPDKWTIKKNLNTVQFAAEQKMPMILYGATKDHAHKTKDDQFFIEIGNTCVKEIMIAYLYGYQFSKPVPDESYNIEIRLTPPQDNYRLTMDKIELVKALKEADENDFTEEICTGINEMIASDFPLTPNESCGISKK